MKRKRWLLMAATGMIATMMLSNFVLALEDSSVNVTINDNAGSESSGIYQVSPSSSGKTEVYPQVQDIPYPVDIQQMNQGERSYLYKTYTIAANHSPNMLVEDPFSQGGYRFRFSEIIQKDSIPGNAQKTVSQTKSVESDTDERATLLALLGDKLSYSDADGYAGELYLQPESLAISEIGQDSYSYTVTDTREFENLENKDWSFIPKTTEKNGMTLSLQNVDWQVTSSKGMGYSDIPTRYTAVAHYSAVASGSKASGYTATASYSGEVTKETIGKNTYTIVYEGEQIVIPFNFAPLIIAGVVVAGCIVAAVILWRLRKNVIIYTLQQGVPELYAKVRVSPKNPVLDLSKITDVGVRLVFDKRFVKSLYDQKVFVIGRFTNYRINITGSLVQELPAQKYTDSVSESAGRFEERPETDFFGGNEI